MLMIRMIIYQNEWQVLSMRRKRSTGMKLYIGAVIMAAIICLGALCVSGKHKFVLANALDTDSTGDVGGDGVLDVYPSDIASPEADFDYEGPIDMFTKSPVSETAGQDLTQRVNVSDGSVYDRASGFYIYAVDNGSVSVSVADGMIVVGDVFLTKSENANVKLYKDGEAVDDFPGLINVPGSYAIISGDMGSDGQIMGFRVLNGVTGAISQYNMPRGFSVQSVVVNGEDVFYDYGVVDMTTEGTYDVNYICSDNGISYYLHVVIDHTPPQVTFEGLDENNRAKGPVTITGLQEGDRVSVLSGNETKKLNSKSQIAESCDYRVIVSDEAGNYIEKQFKIVVYLNLQAWMLLGLALILIVGMAAALTVTRRRLRVR